MTNARYWNAIADAYQASTRISTEDFHFGPLLPGDRELGLLPRRLRGRRCLEIGCGAGQNSIALARAGAECTAVDISTRQLRHGRGLAKEAGVEVEWIKADMNRLPLETLGQFDLVHSTYALPFSADPQAVIRAAAQLTRPRGTFLLTTSHPAYAGEWIENDDGIEGLFLYSYFDPPDDVRPAKNNRPAYRARTTAPSVVFHWLIDAGYKVEQFLEPRPLTIPALTESEIRSRIPYDSPGWREQYPIIQHVPTVAIFRARRTTQPC